MLFTTRRRAIITLSIFLILLLYLTRSFSILIPFSITIIALLLFYYIDASFKFNFPERFYIYIFLIFVFGTIIGADFTNFGFYYRLDFYDKILHFVGPFLLTAIMFFIINRLDITFKWKALISFGLIFGILGLFEIGEYLSDQFFGTLLQGVYTFDLVERIKLEAVLTPIDDTMQDLIYGLLGNALYVGYRSLMLFFEHRKIHP